MGRRFSIGRLTPTGGRIPISGTRLVDWQLGRNLALSIAYVGSAGRRLPSSIDPIKRRRSPPILSMGPRAQRRVSYSGMTSFHPGVPRLTQDGSSKMTGCSPSASLRRCGHFRIDPSHLGGFELRTTGNRATTRCRSSSIAFRQNGFYGLATQHAVENGFRAARTTPSARR